MSLFNQRMQALLEDYETLVRKKNSPLPGNNGWFQRYKNPVLTAAHTPLFWRYDLDPEANPFLMERIGMNGVMNAGAIKWNGNYLLVARVEGSTGNLFRHCRKP